MTVEDLIEFLKDAPRDAHVVIGGEIVSGAIVLTGKVKRNFMFSDHFTVTDKGKDHALMFTHHTEFSDGSHGLSRI